MRDQQIVETDLTDGTDSTDKTARIEKSFLQGSHPLNPFTPLNPYIRQLLFAIAPTK
jgi:hypothetical protein